MSSRKDYEQTAKVIRDKKECVCIDEFTNEDEYYMKLGVLASVAGEFASVYSQDNPKFDRDRFMKACGF